MPQGCSSRKVLGEYLRQTKGVKERERGCGFFSLLALSLYHLLFRCYLDLHFINLVSLPPQLPLN